MVIQIIKRQKSLGFSIGFLIGKKSFKVIAKRSDKRFPLDSMQISAQVGGYVLSCVPQIRVDVHDPEIVVHVEIRENFAYIHAGTFQRKP